MLYLNQIDPIAFQVGPLAVHWYGIMYLLGFAIAWFLGQRRIRAGRLPGVDANAFGDLMFYGMLGVVLGGRIGYILFYDLSTYIAHPLQVFKIWEGGMSFHGGLLGVMVAAFWWARRHRLHFFDVADFIAPLVPPGLGLGRLGNFINGELWGKFTDGGWGVVFPQAPEVAELGLDSRGAAHAVRGRRTERVRAASLAAVPVRAGRRGDVLHPVVVLAQAAPALCGGRACSRCCTACSASPWNSCACPTRSSAISRSAGSRWARC